MKTSCGKKTIVLSILVILGILPPLAEARIQVVASTLEMADFARQVGGDRIEVYAISTGQYDLHFFEPVPSQVMKLRKADLLIVGGLDIDPWIQALIDSAGNPKIRFGATGYVDPSEGVRPLDVPQGRIDGSMGDVHPHGNPHFWFTPENVSIAVANIAKGLARVDPAGTSTYEKNRDLYLENVQKAFAELRRRLAPYRGTAVLQYHPSWNYFCQTFGLEIVGTLEPKPGIPPSPGHLKDLVARASARQADLLLVEPYYPERPVRFIVERTGVQALRLPLYLGGKEGVETYLEHLEDLVDSIVTALRARRSS